MKKIFIIVLLFLGLLTAPQVTNASNWIKYHESVNGNIEYIDVDSIQNNGNRSTAWIKIIRPNNSYAIALFQADFSKRSFAITATADYTPYGELIQKNTLPEYEITWDPVPPDSIAETIYDIMSNYRQEKTIGSLL